MRATWRGREIENPALRGMAVGLAVVVLCLGLMTLALVLMALPLLMAVHPLFRICGRRGTLRRTPTGGVAVVLDRSSFRRMP